MHPGKGRCDIQCLTDTSGPAACVHNLRVPVGCSFAIVIQQLPNPLRDAIAIFYLVLRGLDTVEDDMAIPEAEKIPQLLSFHKDIYNTWVMGCLKVVS